MRIRTIIGLGFISLTLIGTGCATARRAGPVTNQQVHTLKSTVKLTCGYWLYLPEGYGADKEDWPLVLFLHGAVERGDNLDLVKKWGPPKRAAGGQEYPFILVSPQCPAEDWWTSAKQITTLDALLDDIVERYRVDEDRVYVTGLSMGGFGTWELAMQYPDRFAAIIPICGGGNPRYVEHIKHVPAWVFHGAKDTVVPPSMSQDMVDALKACGGTVKFTLYPDATHNSWQETYRNPEVFEWMLAQKRQKAAD